MSARSAAGFRPDQENAAYIGAGVTLKGDISAPDVIVIDGAVEGDVAARVVIVGGAGSVNGRINAVEADIGGAVAGDIHITRLLAIRATGRVEGRVSYGEISLEKGGRLEGELSSSEATSAPLAKAPPAIAASRGRYALGRRL